METSSKELNRVLACNHKRVRRVATCVKTTKLTKTNSMGGLNKRFFVQFGLITPTQLRNISNDLNQAELALNNLIKANLYRFRDPTISEDHLIVFLILCYEGLV